MSGVLNLAETLFCPNEGIAPYAESGMSVALDTNGADAVLIIGTFMVEFPPHGGVFIRPTIDGTGMNTDPQIAQFGSYFDSHRAMISFSRAYSVSPGEHKFGLEWGCRDGADIVTGGMTVVPLR